MNNKRIHNYTLISQLGEGGMAEVWYAENSIGKQAAIKILKDEFTKMPSVLQRFQNEATVMVKLNHKNIRQVYDYGEIDGRPCIIMEYLEGADLSTKLKEGARFTDTQLKSWWNSIVDALNYTHQQGIVHRDIKPSNIFITAQGELKLLDFGIAKIKSSITLTQTGNRMGTLMYMSPEQVIDSKYLDYRSDYYSLAVTFCHLISGNAPYNDTNSSEFQIQTKIVNEPISLINIPNDWVMLLSRNLEKEPEKREKCISYKTVIPDKVEKPSDVEVTKNEEINNKETTIIDEDETKKRSIANEENHERVNIKTPDDKTAKAKNILSENLFILIYATLLIAFVYMFFIKDKNNTTQTKQNNELILTDTLQTNIKPLFPETTNIVQSEVEKKTIARNTYVPEVLTDRDGNTYKTLIIGNRIWMTENFRLVTPKSVPYPGKDVEKYGRIYPRKEASTNAPKGWRLPNWRDFNSLIDFCGGKKKASIELTEKGSSGFNALLGIGTSSAYFHSTGKLAYGEDNEMALEIADFWSGEVAYSNVYYHFTINPSKRNIGWSGEAGVSLFSVRYVKDL